MRSFKKIICLGMVVAIIVGINTILNLAFQPYNNFRNDMHNLDTHNLILYSWEHHTERQELILI